MTYQPIYNASLPSHDEEEYVYQKSITEKGRGKLYALFGLGLVVGLCIGAAAVSFAGSPWSQSPSKGMSVTTFTNNVTFMSLDHKFDKLWDIKREMNYADLSMPDDETADADMPVIVTM